MTSTKTYLLPILFFTILLLHTMDSFWHILPQPELDEQRVLDPKPVFNPGHLDPFPRDYEAYYNDHFTWRNGLVWLNNQFNFYTLKQSPLPDKVIIGKKNWLFKGGHQMDIAQGKFQFTPQEIREIIQELEFRRRQVEATGANYYFSIPPTKHSIYPEYLPDRVKRLNPKTSTEQLIEAIKTQSSIRYIDLYPVLLKAKNEIDSAIFYYTDHHWNPIGGLVATNALIDTLRQDFPEIPPFDWQDYYFQYEVHEGKSLANLLGMSKQLTEIHPRLYFNKERLARDTSRSYPSPRGFPYPDEYAMAKTTRLTSLPKLMMVRESYANYLIEPLSEYFSESFYLFDNWEHQFQPELLAIEQPDIYIDLCWEGLLYTLLDRSAIEEDW